jgi:hypothetical protein
MRRGLRLAAAGAGLVLLAACGGDDKAGTGFLDVGDLSTPPATGHFTGPAERLTGRLTARDNGCVNVVVAGVERVPLWPDGTEVAAKSGDRYVVTLPGGTKLSAEGPDGDTFTAEGVVDGGGDFTSKVGDPAGKVASFLDFCGVDAAPVAFKDAATFTAEPNPGR